MHFRVVLASIVGVLGELMVPVLTVPGKPALPGRFESGLACFADGFTSSFVFVVRGHVADALVEPHPVVVIAGDLQLGTQGGRVSDREQVQVVGLVPSWVTWEPVRA
jgi:hypothetical protein